MKDIGFDLLTHDLILTENDLVIVDQADSVQQLLKQRLSTFLGEWFLDPTIGVPYYDDILVKNPNIPDIDSILKATILETPEVEEILEFNSDFENRKLSIDSKVRSVYGERELSVTLFG